MKRDMELIRRIPLQLEADTELFPTTVLKLQRHSQAEIGYHMLLLFDAGLVEGHSAGSKGDPYGYMAERLTWDGHDFLNLARNDSVWKKAMSGLAEKGLDVTIDILTTYLAKLTKKMLMLG